MITDEKATLELANRYRIAAAARRAKVASTLARDGINEPQTTGRIHVTLGGQPLSRSADFFNRAATSISIPEFSQVRSKKRG